MPRSRTSHDHLSLRSWLLLFTLIFPARCLAAAQEPAAKRLETADQEPQNRLTYGGNYSAWRYSSLTQITRDNVKTMVPVWAFPTGELRGGLNATPLVVKDKVIVGGTGGEHAQRGYLKAFDARTGKFIWRFYTIPGPGEPGFETWSKESWKDGDDRAGDNLYTDALIALTTRSGKRLVGLKRDEDSETVRSCDMSSMPPVSRTVVKSEIVKSEKLKTSAMPGNYGKKYSGSLGSPGKATVSWGIAKSFPHQVCFFRQFLKSQYSRHQLLDLVAFLKAGG